MCRSLNVLRRQVRMLTIPVRAAHSRAYLVANLVIQLIALHDTDADVEKVCYFCHGDLLMKNQVVLV